MVSRGEGKNGLNHHRLRDMVIDPLPAVGWDGLLQNNVPGNHLFITGKEACVPPSGLHAEKMEDAMGQDRIDQYSDSISPSAIELKY